MGGCTRAGTIVHEIGHAIGFWHEQSRPDRDGFVTINSGNIQAGKEHNFAKRSADEIDSQGSQYDYASIMHYPVWAFSRNGNPTLSVNNAAAYAAQGSPILGQRSALSAERRAWRAERRTNPGRRAVR